MMIDAPQIWTPPAPAIIRPAEHALLKPGAFRPCTRAEGRTILAELVRSGRMTRDEATAAVIFIPWIGSAPSSGHRYWRLYITGFTNGTFHIIAEIELRIGGVDQVPAMTGFTTSGVTVSASSSYGGRPVYNAFDDSGTGDGSSYWTATGASPPVWVKVDFGAGNGPAALTSVAMAPRDGDGQNYIVTAFSLQYSDDNSAWTTVGSWSGLTSGWSPGTLREFSI